MKNTTFKWDNYLQKASFDDVRGLQVHSGRFPSMYNPERTELYLTSLDVSVKVDDAKGLKIVAGDVADALASKDPSSLSDLRKIVDLRTDHNEIANLLHGLGESFEPLQL